MMCGCDCASSDCTPKPRPEIVGIDCGCSLCASGKWRLAAPPSSIEREPFSSKMDDWEQCAPVALRYLIDWMRDEPETLLALAKGRVAWGHYRHGDTLMYEFTEAELVANASEELGDAINYIARLIHLRSNQEPPTKFTETYKAAEWYGQDELIAS